ncbi:SDR family NAD(P)-dependent oxidoreductase [Nocardia sp. NPDC051570]|uniref:SDR family NAD(P)-dependent oxidoreductase n=1 Tax=Nocardia sp. NPDC051570 TaxID=3364324 RepID=UPI0037B9D795
MEWIVDISFWGVAHGTSAFLPVLRRSGGGTVVNVSSASGPLGMPSQLAYAATKFAVRGFTESLRMELLIAGWPTRVMCVHPGRIRTSPDRAARAIVDGVARHKIRLLVGVDAVVMDVLQRAFPVGYQRLAGYATRQALRSYS